MKIKNLTLIIAAMLSASCANDNDFFPSFDDNCNWKTSLDEIITDNDQLFENRGIKITTIKFLKDISVDRELFFGDQYGSFPVYSKNDSVFTVITYNELVKNSDMYSFDTTSVVKNINRLIENSEDYEVVELTWLCENKTYNSLAFFNTRTGELEYDNMLFNMSTISRYERESFSRTIVITETESGVADSGSDCVVYQIGNSILAKSGINWTVRGTWDRNLYYDYEDDYYIYYNVYSTFTVSHVQMTPISYILSDDDSDVFYETRDYSVSGSSTYNFTYAIWAGPQGGLNLNQFGDHTAFLIMTYRYVVF